MAGVVALIALLADVANDAFGYVAIEYKAQPAAVLADYFAQNPPAVEVDAAALAAELAAQPPAVLLGVLQAGLRRAPARP